MTVRWITPLLGTASAISVQDLPDTHVIDVRDLVDKAGNNRQAVLQKIRQGVELLEQGKRAIVVCDYGISRSNAVATGILASFEKIAFGVAVRRVLEATGESQIKLDPLNAVQEALGLSFSRVQSGKYRSVLVTGGSGFLGRRLSASISDEFRVVSPTREQLDISLGNTQLNLLTAEENIDCLVHLANPRVYTSNVAMGQTITMLRNVIEVSVMQNIPMVYLSSWEIYSGYAGMLRADESTPALPRGPYGETKYLAEVLIEHSRRTEGLQCALLRSSPVYGSGSDRPKFLFNFIEKAKQAQTIRTHRYSNGEPALDLLYVDDLISALTATLRCGFVGTLNLGTGEVTSTRQIAQMLINRLGSHSQIEQSPINANVASIAMDSRRAIAVLDWQPTVTLERGLDRMLLEINSNNEGDYGS